MTHQKQTLKSRVISTDMISWRDLQFIQQDDFKELPADAHNRLRTSILANDFTQPFYVWEEQGTGINYCLDGKHRVMILEELQQEGYDIPEMLPATFMHCEDKQDAARLVLIYSSMYAKVTTGGLVDFISLYELNYDEMSLVIDLPGMDDFKIPELEHEEPVEIVARSLQERFIVPPFSIFDTRQGYWQDRKRLWHRLGFNSQETREDIELVAISGQSPAIYELRNQMRNELKREPEWVEIIARAKGKGMHIYEGASIFDPVLAEIAYKWFCPPAGSVLDPFAGGSVRGIVASISGLLYYGIDLRRDQVNANRKQADRVCTGYATPTWLTGNSKKVIPDMEGDLFDLVFSCPPYHDLEHYSDDPEDLSNMDYLSFLCDYREIITHAVQRLKDNRFACFVVSDIRDKEGMYRNFVSDTIEAFQDAGMQLYNEIILINVAGSLPIRVGRQFEAYRKVGKMHQNVLVFYKGDTKKIKEEFPEIKVPDTLQSLESQPNIALQ